MIIIPLLLLVLGFFLLVRSSDWLIDGTSSVAKRFHVPDLTIGLTIIAFGTSAPELMVSLIAAFTGSGDLSVANIIGSNIANILLILGVAAVIYPLTVKRSTTWKEIPFSLLAIIILGVMALDSLRTGSATFQRSDGIILLSFFVLFMVYVFDMVRSGSRPADLKDIEVKHMKVKKAVFLMVAGIIGLALGGRAVVSGAVVLARTFGFSERLIGLTIVAIGTSLPELVTSAVAAFKHRADIAVGNIIGSNIFNIFWILGLTATIRPISVPVDILGDILVAIGATLLLMLFLFVGPRRRLDRVKGSLLLASYFGYLVYLVVVR